MDINSVTSNEYVIVLLGLVAAYVLAKVAHIILSKYIKGLTQKTKTDLDDRLLAALGTPFVAGVVLVVLFFTAQRTVFIQQNKAIYDGIYYVIAILWILFVSQRIVKVGIQTWLAPRGGAGGVPRLFINTIYVFIYMVGLIIILKHFNVEISPLIATLGIGGLAIGLALQDTLSNFFGGVYIASDKPIRVKDYIELDNGLGGHIEDIGWRTTRIKTLPGNIIVVPNSKIANSVLTNYDLTVPEMSVVVKVGVSYKSDLKEVEKVTADVARKTQKTVQGAVREFEPFIRYNEFGDSNINFSVILRVEKFVDKYLVMHEFIKALKEAYDKNGIEISSPVRKVHLSKGKG